MEKITSAFLSLKKIGFSKAALIMAGLFCSLSANSALIGVSSGLDDDLAMKNQQSPLIEAKGRKGAEKFKDLSASFGEQGLKKLATRAKEVISEQPDSGLAHEILGTVYYYSSEFQKA